MDARSRKRTFKFALNATSSQTVGPEPGIYTTKIVVLRGSHEHSTGYCLVVDTSTLKTQPAKFVNFGPLGTQNV